MVIETQDNMFEIAYAKVNLALHILRRRADGYHDIDTVFSFVEDGDRLNVQKSDELSLLITGPFASELSLDIDNNLVMKVARLLQRQFKVYTGASLSLDKRLPVASGIGGGSADAAAAARLLNRFWKLNLSNQKLAKLFAPLGADIPACIYSETCKGEGIGADIKILPKQQSIKGLPILLVNPMIQVPTGPIFENWDGVSSKELSNYSLDYIIKHSVNDMQRAATSLFPEIDIVLNVLQESETFFSRMSGSGATCFAIFETETDRDNAAQKIRNEYKGWWLMSGCLK